MSRKIEVTAEKLCEGQSWIKYFKYQDTEYRILISGGDGKYSNPYNPKRDIFVFYLYPDKKGCLYNLVEITISRINPYPKDGETYQFKITITELVTFDLEDE